MPMAIHHFKLTQTNWIFVAGGAAEQRHLDDIIFGALVLIKNGVSPTAIHIFTDHPKASNHFEELEMDEQIKPLSAFFTSIKDIGGSEHCVVIVSGHGSPEGIPIIEGEKVITISPSAFLDAVRSVKDIKTATIVLGQCYAGIFNFLDARTEPKLSVLGATNLYSSLSSPLGLMQPLTTPKGKEIISAWNANLFLAFFFLWFLHPRDVDGDGKLTLLDAFKFAGTESNRHVQSAKINLNSQVDSAKKKFDEHTASTPPEGIDVIQFETEKLLTLKALESNIKELMSLIYTHQEPWILHPDLARETILTV